MKATMTTTDTHNADRTEVRKAAAHVANLSAARAAGACRAAHSALAKLALAGHN